MTNKEQNKGFAVIIIIVLIFVVGLAVGGIFYFLGSQKASSQATPTPAAEDNTQSETMTKTESTTVSDSLDDTVIQSELDATELNSVDADLKNVEEDAATIK